MNYSEIIKKLKSHKNPKNIAGMARFGISVKNTLGVPVPIIRRLGKQIGKNQELALKLWKSEIHEARILASIVAEPQKMKWRDAEKWVDDFDSWDICDQACMNLFRYMPGASGKALAWIKKKKEFTRRAGFALMAALAFAKNPMTDGEFKKFFPAMKKYAMDERNYVRKAVDWALRQIGKRNLALNKEALKVAQEISRIESKSAKWIAGDAMRELQSAAVQKRIEK